MRVGIGYDVHRLVESRALILGGVKIEHSLGLLGHSDADVLVHAIMDALLGALALGDIGKHFPDTDEAYKDCDSLMLLKKVGQLIAQKGYRINNIDSTIIAQAPKLKPYMETMIENISRTLDLSGGRVSIKATTEEGLGFTGSELGIAANAVVSLVKGEII
nr:2-C-methyl-D-erythritol 2,4-cyclodiphosphate synthase [uncultured Acetobacterium sp.]